MGSPAWTLSSRSRVTWMHSLRCGAGRPYSTPCHDSTSPFTPAPKPSTKRPPLILSISSAVSAIDKGLLTNASATAAPSSMRLVKAAAAAG